MWPTGKRKVKTNPTHDPDVEISEELIINLKNKILRKLIHFVQEIETLKKSVMEILKLKIIVSELKKFTE